MMIKNLFTFTNVQNNNGSKRFCKKGTPGIILIGVMACLMMVGITGCGDAPPDSSPEPGGNDTGESVAQEITVAISTDVQNWDRVNFPGGDSRFVWSQVYETLVRLDTDLNEQPGLATSWEPSEGGKVWTFSLREGVIFHDGTPFNSDAILHSYDQNSYAFRTTLPVEEVIALDEYTVQFVLRNASPFPSYLTHVAWPVMSPDSVDDEGNFTGAAGTGPYMLEEHVTDQEIILVRNDDYWGEKGTLDRVIFKVIPDATARVMALEAEQVDMALKLNEFDAERLTGSAHIQIHKALSTFTDFLQFNTNKAPLDDVRVRKAVALAIDTEQIVNELLAGYNIPAMGRPLSPVMKYSNQELHITPDGDKARELLEEAGWEETPGGIREKDGNPLKLRALLAAWGPRQKTAGETIQGRLRDVGIDMELLEMETGAITEAENKGEFDILVRSGYLTWGDYPHHLKIHTSWHPFSHYANEEYDQLVMAAESSDYDDQAKMDLYDQAQRLIMEQMPAFYILHEEKVVATNKRVRNYRISAEDPWLNLAGITVE